MSPTQQQIESLRDESLQPQRLFIGGRHVEAQNGAVMDVLSPINGRTLTTIADASSDDVDRAVVAARGVFERGSWSRAAPAERKRTLMALAGLIEKHALELAVLGVRDNGTEISMAYKAEPLSAAATFRWYAEAIDKVYGEIAPTPPTVLGLIHREPLGVIAAIVPWNFPLMIGAWKIAPALAAGNSVVVKPSEGAALTMLGVAELAAQAGLPEGVFNVVTGRSERAGEAIGLHRDVNAIAFTGSGGVGRRLLEYAARSNLKRVLLELGGKSPNVPFADCSDLDRAVKTSAQAIFRNAGQVCVAGSRLLVQRPIYDAVVRQIAQIAEGLKVGDPLRLETEVGAVSSPQHLARIMEFVSVAQTEGAELVAGGRQVLAETGGTYMAPTVFGGVTAAMHLFHEEVFGPVLAVTAFDDEAEAMHLANATELGLAAAVWTSDLSRAHRMVRAIRAGVVHVNTYGGTDITVPLGDFKQSGFGRDKSLHAFDTYTDLKTAWIAL